MPEQELERLRQVANRLTAAHQEALNAVVGALEYSGERGLVDDEAQSSGTQRLEATLLDVRAILEGAVCGCAKPSGGRQIVDDSGPSRPLWCKTLSLFTELSRPIAPVV